MQKLVVASIFGAAILAAGSASAETDHYTSSFDGSARTVVRIQDLNLSTPQGAAALKVRLQSASERVCGPRPQTAADLGGAGRFQTCVRDTFAAAMAAAPPGAQQVAVIGARR